MEKTNHLSIKHISLSADGSQLLINFAFVSEQVSEQQLLQLLQDQSLPRFKVNEQGITDAIKSFENLHNNPESDLAHFSPIAIADIVDAQLEVSISKDKMFATAEITCAYGGEHISLAEIKTVCENLNISYGLMPKTILGLINTCKKAKPGKTFRATIARGTPPEDGQDAYFKKLVKTDNHRAHVPKRLENGNVDMHDLGDTITVKPNTILMEKVPATEGSPGKTVNGEVVNQKKGEDKKYVLTDNVHLSKKNPLFLVSNIQGIPIEDHGFIRVDDVLLLTDINVKTGNINYDGSVMVTGDIHEGMKLEVTGDVTVMGFIESASIKCGGDLTVKKSIIGRVKEHSHEFCCDISCDGTLRGVIASYTRLKVGKDVIFTDQLLHCLTECKGSIQVHDEHMRRGAIIGGELYAKGNISTVNIGTEAGSKTLIDLTANFADLAEKRKILNREYQQIDSIIEKFRIAQSRAESLLDAKQRKATKNKLMQEKQLYRDESDKVQHQLAEVKMEIADYYAQSYVIAHKALHSGTTVNIGEKTLTTTEGHKASKVCLLEEKLQVSAYQKD